MKLCTECSGAAAWEISWSPTELNLHSCDEHLPELCRTYSLRRIKERPQDDFTHLLVMPLTQLDLPKFAVADWFQITGRGWVASIEGIPDFDPTPLLHKDVLLDGKLYNVRGVETVLIPRPAGRPFGLLVGSER